MGREIKRKREGGTLRERGSVGIWRERYQQTNKQTATESYRQRKEKVYRQIKRQKSKAFISQKTSSIHLLNAATQEYC